MTLSDRFHDMLCGHEDDPAVQGEVAELVFNAADSPERDGLLALIYHEGIGVPGNMDKCFDFAEKAAFDGGNGLGYFMLGYMCDNAETPDQAEGGPRQKYDHYDAERFYELSSKIDSKWREFAILWLGDYYMDMAKGGDPEIAVEYYESIAENNAEAAGKLSDFYWNLIMPEYIEDEEWTSKLFKWSRVAESLNPEEYTYRMGWIYADGLGCEKSSQQAVEKFAKAYGYGDWRGAKSVATVFEELLEENPDIVEREDYEEKIRLWNERADVLREKELSEGLDEPDNPIEED